MLATARRLKEEDGFTLVELLIVIVVLGVLSTVVVFSISGINTRAKAATCASDKATVSTAAEAFYTLNGTYPKAEADLVGTGKLLVNTPSTLKITYVATGATAPTTECIN